MQAPEQLSQASVDGAPVWSSGDQKTAPSTSEEISSPKDGIFQLGSSQIFKVNALRMVGGSGWGGLAMLCSDPHHLPSDRASSCWRGLAGPRGSELGPGVSIKTKAGISPVSLVIHLECLEKSLALGPGLGSWGRGNWREGPRTDPEVSSPDLSPSSVPLDSVT